METSGSSVFFGKGMEAVKRETETRELLLASAKAEFLEKGYMKASLRNICKNAGVTTGALYFFFRDKDDLFVSLLKEPVEEIKKIMFSHYEEERQLAEQGKLVDDDRKDDLEATEQVIRQMYRYREEVLILLTKAQGSSMEHVLDEFVEIGELHFRRMAEAMCRQMGKAEVAGNVIHWIAHLQVDIFVYAVTHIETEEEAAAYMKCVVKYMTSGWFGMIGD